MFDSLRNGELRNQIASQMCRAPGSLEKPVNVVQYVEMSTGLPLWKQTMLTISGIECERVIGMWQEGSVVNVAKR